MITLAGFIVVAQDAQAGDDEGERILELMRRSTNGVLDSPYAYFRERYRADLVALSE